MWAGTHFSKNRMMKAGFFLPGVLAAGMLVLFTSGIARAQDDDGEGQRASKDPTAEEVKGIVARAEGMLRVVRPSQDDVGRERGEWKVMQTADGEVRWGNFLRAGEVSALVTVRQPGVESEFDPLRHDLCYFAWRKDHWEFRQYLGNASDLEIHYRKDHPAVFLQGSFRAGRYEGEFVSWFLDEKTGKLVPTDFEDWGPFSLKGNFLVGERGFERLAHDGTFWIHSYKDGRKGPLLARFHGDDRGGFDVSFPDSKTGRWVSWIFRQDCENESRMEVSVAEDKTKDTDDEAMLEEGQPAKRAEIRGEVDSAQVFEKLTGLDPALLDTGWLDELPPRPPVKLAPLEVSGDAEIASRLGGADARALEEEGSRRALAFLKDVVPGESVQRSMAMHGGDIRGVWGRLFGTDDVMALLAEGMATKRDDNGGDAQLFLLRWKGGWEVVQKVGAVSGSLDSDEKPYWTVRAHEKPACYYVLSHTSPNWTEKCASWRYDAAAGKLVPTGWPTNGRPSISGDTLTISSRDMSEAGAPAMEEVYRFADGKLGARVGEIRRGFSDGHLLRATITVPNASGGDVTWRIWKMTPEYKPRADVYALCRDEGAGRNTFHADATIEFDWGEGGPSDESAAEYVWWRLTGTGMDAYHGTWPGEVEWKLRVPKTAKVTGLPEAVARFEWPQPGR
jgi:hypothetical protein